MTCPVDLDSILDRQVLERWWSLGAAIAAMLLLLGVFPEVDAAVERLGGEVGIEHQHGGPDRHRWFFVPSGEPFAVSNNASAGMLVREAARRLGWRYSSHVSGEG
jgi:hypothetical protein